MLEEQTLNPNSPDQGPYPPTGISSTESTKEQLRKQRQIIIGVILFMVLVLGVAITAIYLLIQPTTDTERVRDVFIVMIAAQTLLLGFVLVILIIQLARLINLLQNEIRPILESTNETSRTLRGTASFLSEHLAEPVIKMNETLAGFQRLTDLFYPNRRRRG